MSDTPTKADVLASLEAAGIRSMDDLAEQLRRKARDDADPAAGAPAPIDVEALRRPLADAPEAGLEHPVPPVPFLHRGVEHDPEDIRRFDGTNLAYVPIRTASGGTGLQVLDDVPAVRGWLERRLAGRLAASFATGLTPTAGHEPGPGHAVVAAGLPTSVTVGEHVLTIVIGPEDPPTPWVGNTLTLHPGWYYPDLTQVWLNWPFSRWNDAISFIGASSSTCAFWDHVGAQGNLLLSGAPTGTDWLPNLAAIGWNDRISSFVNYG